MPTAQQLVNQGYTGYQGWSDAAANDDFNATGGAGKGGPSSGGDGGFNFSTPTFDPNSIPVSQATLTPSSINIDDYIKAIQDTLPAPPEEYMTANPFYFDEQAARDVSTAEFAPYYDELLQDYLGEVKLTSEKNRGDTTRILADLDKQKELFFQNNGQEFEKTIRGIKEGYSAKGTYFSGFNNRDQTEAGAANTNKLEGYLNTYGTKKAEATSDDAYQQTVMNTAAANKARDIGREKTASIYGGINTQKDEAIDEYLYGMKTYYKNPDYKNLSVASETGNTNLQQGTQY
jgi:hypothetical protein